MSCQPRGQKYHKVTLIEREAESFPVFGRGENLLPTMSGPGLPGFPKNYLRGCTGDGILPAPLGLSGDTQRSGSEPHPIQPRRITSNNLDAILQGQSYEREAGEAPGNPEPHPTNERDGRSTCPGCGATVFGPSPSITCIIAHQMPFCQARLNPINNRSA